MFVRRVVLVYTMNAFHFVRTIVWLVKTILFRIRTVFSLVRIICYSCQKNIFSLSICEYHRCVCHDGFFRRVRIF